MGVILAGAVAVAVFAYLSLVQWTNARTSERNTRERLALMSRLAEQPAEGVKLVLDLLREDDRRAEQERLRRAREERRGGVQTGAILIAVGAGLSLFIYSVTRTVPGADTDARNAWTIGLMLVLMGLVFVVSSWFRKDNRE